MNTDRVHEDLEVRKLYLDRFIRDSGVLATFNYLITDSGQSPVPCSYTPGMNIAGNSRFFQARI